GKTYYEPTHVSPEMQAKIDAEVRSIIEEAYKRAVVILKKYRKKMDDVVKKLMEVETMDGDEFEGIMKA
ncbi:MAG: cell division protein FtsH, partial [Patescibacteria group bacterium]